MVLLCPLILAACMPYISLEKTAQFVRDVTDGALSPSVGMINGLCREFSSKSKQEQDELFVTLLDAPVMHVDGTVARVNGNNKNVVVCSNGMATMYFARENTGHAGIKDTSVETFSGILIHMTMRRVFTAMAMTIRNVWCT